MNSSLHPKLVTSFIDGAFVPPSPSAHRLDIINPSTEGVLAQLCEAEASEVDRAVQAAHTAYEQGRWRNLPMEQRAAVMRRVAELTEQHSDALCQLETLDLGMPVRLAQGMVTSRVARNFRFYADFLSQAAERAVRVDGQYQRYVHRDPIGVCGLISPWNAPLMLATSKIAPALAFGNTCVIKPSEYTPLALARFMELLIEAGVPAGVVNMVNGRGHVTGAALVDHPQVRMVSFTGGGEAGRAIASSAGRGLKKCDLELGGKSACIISDSADLDSALEGCLQGIYPNSGQACFANSRVLLQRGIADQFLERFVARSRQVRVGDPQDAATEMGPLAYAAHFERVRSFCEPDAADRVQVLCGGERVGTQGYFLQATVLLTDNPQARAWREEIFGPVVTFMVYDTFEQALELANDSRYGLAAYLWSNRLDEVTAASEHLLAGTLMVNSPMVLDLRMPFGGYNESGVGREGIEGMRALYTEEKSVALALRPFTPALRFGASGAAE